MAAFDEVRIPIYVGALLRCREGCMTPDLICFLQDLSGTIEEDELVMMLTAPPWKNLFPEDTRKKVRLFNPFA